MEPLNFAQECLRISGLISKSQPPTACDLSNEDGQCLGHHIVLAEEDEAGWIHHAQGGVLFETVVIDGDRLVSVVIPLAGHPNYEKLCKAACEAVRP